MGRRYRSRTSWTSGRWANDPNQIRHSGGWDWMNISKKQARKMSSRDWHKRFAEAGLYETGNNRREHIDRDAWKKLGWKKRKYKSGGNKYWEWKGDKKTKEKTWRLYGELTGMTRFSDIDKDNYEDVNWEAKFKDRPNAWEKVEENWGDLDDEQKWAAYSELKEEVPEDYEDVAGSDEAAALQTRIDLTPIPDLVDYGPIKERDEFDIDPYEGDMFEGDDLKDEWKPTEILPLEDTIKNVMGKDHEDHPDFPEDPGEHWWDPTAGEDGQGAYRNAEGTVTDRPGVDPRDPESVTGDDAIGLPKPGLTDTDGDGKLETQTDQLADFDVADKGVQATGTGIDTPEDVTDVTHDTSVNLTGDIDRGASTTAELGQAGQSAITDASKTFDDQPAVPAPRDPNDPRDQPDPVDATAWQGTGAQARMEGLGTEFAKYDTFPKTGTNTQITSALGSRLKRSQAAKTGRNTLGTGAFKFRNPLSIN